MPNEQRARPGQAEGCEADNITCFAARVSKPDSLKRPFVYRTLQLKTEGALRSPGVHHLQYAGCALQRRDEARLCSQKTRLAIGWTLVEGLVSGEKSNPSRDGELYVDGAVLGNNDKTLSSRNILQELQHAR